MTHTVTLKSWQQAHPILQRTAEWIKGRTLQGRPVVLTVGEETRNLAQNALLHALLTDIAKSHEWAGAKRDAETWKRLMVGAWCRANGEQIELLPALDGHGVEVVFRRTSKMTKVEVADLIEFIHAWQAEHSA